MTYDARELSMQGGEPIEMYHFTVNSTHYRFTSAKSAVTYDGDTYQPALIKRDSIDFTTEKGRNNLKLQTARDFAIADLFRISPPSDVILLVVHRVHYGDSSGAVVWSGRVLNCEWSGSTASLNCEPVSSSLQRVGLRRLYQRQCPHVLYGSACGLNKDDHDLTVPITDIDGLTLTTSTLIGGTNDYNGSYTGGFAVFNNEKRFIVGNPFYQIKLNAPFSDLEVGDNLVIYKGCNHTVLTCYAEFDNLDNYGGMPHIPNKNPFSGSLL